MSIIDWGFNDTTVVTAFLWPKAFNQIAEETLAPAFNETTLNDAYQRNNATKNAKVIRLNTPNYQITFENGEIKITVSDVSLLLHEIYPDQAFGFKREITGSMELVMDGKYVESTKSVAYRATTRIDLRVANGLIVNPGCKIDYTKNSSKKRNYAEHFRNPNTSLPHPYELQCSRMTLGPSRKGATINVMEGELLVIDGKSQRVNSQQNGSFVIADELSSRITSTGKNVCIDSEGKNCVIETRGDDAQIKENGVALTIRSSGNRAIILSEGDQVDIHSKGSDATIHATGCNIHIRAEAKALKIDHIGILTGIMEDSLNKQLNRNINRNPMDNSIEVINNTIKSRHTVFLPGIDDQEDQWIAIYAVPIPEYSGRMWTMFVPRSALSTIASSFHYGDQDSCIVKDEDLFDEPFEAGAVRQRLSDYFPELSTTYPEASVEVQIMSTIQPITHLLGEKLKINMKGSAKFWARRKDDCYAEFLEAEIELEIDIRLIVRMGLLQGTVEQISPISIALAGSKLNHIDRDTLYALFDRIASKFLLAKFEKVAQSGLALPHPLLPAVEELGDYELSVSGEFLRLDADVKFSA